MCSLPSGCWCSGSTSMLLESLTHSLSRPTKQLQHNIAQRPSSRICSPSFLKQRLVPPPLQRSIVTAVFIQAMEWECNDRVACSRCVKLFLGSGSKGAFLSLKLLRFPITATTMVKCAQDTIFCPCFQQLQGKDRLHS